MKIRKFNENTEVKLWSEREFFDFFDRKEIVDNEYEDLKSSVNSYLVLNSNLVPENVGGYPLRNRYLIGDIYLDDNNDIEIELQHRFTREKKISYYLTLNKGLTEDFLFYLENPEFYETTGKYNL